MSCAHGVPSLQLKWPNLALDLLKVWNGSSPCWGHSTIHCIQMANCIAYYPSCTLSSLVSFHALLLLSHPIQNRSSLSDIYFHNSLIYSNPVTSQIYPRMVVSTCSYFSLRYKCLRLGSILLAVLCFLLTSLYLSCYVGTTVLMHLPIWCTSEPWLIPSSFCPYSECRSNVGQHSITFSLR